MLKHNRLIGYYRLNYCNEMLFKKTIKSFLYFILLLIANNVLALNAISSEKIRGNSPYLTFDEGVTVSDTLLPLLSITLPDDQHFTPLNDTSSMSEPIQVTEGAKFSDIQMNVLLPSKNPSYPEQLVSDVVINSNYWKDNDGDTTPTITGKLKVTWHDVDGNDITNIIKNNVNRKLEGCNSPYRVTIEATDIKLSTAYGLPQLSKYTGGKHTYYIHPDVKKEDRFCYAQPNLYWEYNVNAKTHFRSVTNGPDWLPGRGFNVYYSNHPEKNFPTTGSNNLFFDLKIAGLTAKKIIEINGSYVNAISGTGVSLLLSDHDGVLRVKLKGPSLASNGGDFSPSTFRLYQDSGKTNYFYTFTIQRWYIGTFGAKTYYESADKCASLNGSYRVPGVLDLTNSNRMWAGIDWGDGLPDALDVYQRRISFKKEDGKWMGGLFSEWGSMVSKYGSSEIFYPDSDWENFPGPRNIGSFYWTSTDKLNGRMNYLVDSRYGIVGHTVKNDESYRAACVTP